MAQHGGYRQPSNPAPVSGPGALSQRTDGGPAQPVRVAPGGEYGERQEMEALQGSAQMQGGGGQIPQGIPLSAPTMAPNEPITAGAALGPGIGPQGAGILDDHQVSNEQLKPLLRSLELIANLPGSNAETRSMIRNLKARLGSA